MFQLKKCNNCAYCTVINPPRLPVAEFQSLHFLPDPVPGGDGHYQSFEEVGIIFHSKDSETDQIR